MEDAAAAEAAVGGSARAAPVAVVLQTAAYVVGVPVVDEDLVVLRQDDVLDDVPVGTPPSMDTW